MLNNMKIAKVFLVFYLVFQMGCGGESKQDFPDLENYRGQSLDILVLYGEPIVPLAIQKIQDKSTPKRSFIILFLGNGEYKEAAPILEILVQDELDADRNVALVALFQIDKKLAQKYAVQYKNEKSKLGEISKDIWLDKPYLYKRTSYFEALLGYYSLRPND
jgi:hypothetical protein